MRSGDPTSELLRRASSRLDGVGLLGATRDSPGGASSVSSLDLGAHGDRASARGVARRGALCLRGRSGQSGVFGCFRILGPGSFFLILGAHTFAGLPVCLLAILVSRNVVEGGTILRIG